jgi:hypothetical protein
LALEFSALFEPRLRDVVSVIEKRFENESITKASSVNSRIDRAGLS